MKGTGVYIPSNKVYNEELDKHFDDASYNEYVTYPKCGMSKVALKAINEKIKKGVDYYEFNKYNLSDRQRMVLFFLCGYIDDTA